MSVIIDRAALRRTRVGNAERTGSRALGLLGLPAVLWYTVFTIGPLVSMFYLALLEWPSIVAPSTFAGLDNFRTVFSDPRFWTACTNTVVHLVVTLTIMLPTAFLLGYYVAMKPRGNRLLRVVLFTPALISLAAKAMIFFAIFAPTGLLNATLNALGLEVLARPWLASTDTALGTVIAVDLWAGIGFTAVLFSARISGIAGETFEAAQLDGAGHWRRVWSIAFPICRDYFGVLLMLQFIWLLFGSAGSILLLTRGGPGSSSTTLSFLLYVKAFGESSIGYSQAVGVLLFVVGVVGIIVIRRIFRPAS